MQTFFKMTAVMTLMLLGMLALFVAGCSGATPATKASVNQIENKADIDAAAAAAKGKVADAKGEASPASHPIDAASATVGRIRRPLIFVTILAVIVLGGMIGLEFTAFSFVGQIGIPISAGVLATSFTGAIALPFLANPWFLLAVAAAIAGLIVYEIEVKKQSLAGIEAEVTSVVKAAAAKI